MIVEQQTNMRFAWQKEKSGSKAKIRESGISRFILFVYNAVWWLPIILAFAKVVDYQVGFISFFVITFIRAAANFIFQATVCPSSFSHWDTLDLLDRHTCCHSIDIPAAVLCLCCSPLVFDCPNSTVFGKFDQN